MKYSDLIKKRKSVRTYKKDNISQEDLTKLKDYLSKPENITGPFGGKINVSLILLSKEKAAENEKLGTYGIIRNPQAYLTGVTHNSTESLVEYAYVLEKFVLFCTQIGLSTCWLGGTFTRSSFENKMKIKAGEIVPAILSIGYTKEKRSFLDSTMRVMSKADKRKPYNEIFFDYKLSNPLTLENSDDYKLPFEMIRIAPSASNKQPWRIVLSKDKTSVHFFLLHTNNSMIIAGYDIQKLDIGIAMCHFDMICKELSISGTWKNEQPILKLPNEFYEYISSWDRN